MTNFSIHPIPRTWNVQCEYCKTWNNIHESDIMRKARRLCINRDIFPSLVFADLDWYDHAKTDELGQLQFLLKIHDQTDCHCLDRVKAHVEAHLTDTEPPEPATPNPLSAPVTRSTTPPTQSHANPLIMAQRLAQLHQHTSLPASPSTPAH